MGQADILKVLCRNPGRRFSAKALSRIMGVPINQVTTVCSRLCNGKMCKSETISMRFRAKDKKLYRKTVRRIWV
jgi:predicted AAA+ superfamily ATPase